MRESRREGVGRNDKMYLLICLVRDCRMSPLPYCLLARRPRLPFSFCSSPRSAPRFLVPVFLVFSCSLACFAPVIRPVDNPVYGTRRKNETLHDETTGRDAHTYEMTKRDDEPLGNRHDGMDAMMPLLA